VMFEPAGEDMVRYSKHDGKNGGWSAFGDVTIYGGKCNRAAGRRHRPAVTSTRRDLSYSEGDL
jgi:hypothetical protein